MGGSRTKKVICDTRCYSARIMLAVFAGNPATIVVSAYSTTNVSDCKIEQFYNNLRTAIQDIPDHNFLAVLGDFNARLGPKGLRFPYHDATNL